MSQVAIENPILNSPYVEPTRHFKFGDDGITDEIAQGRRESSYFIPIPRAKKQDYRAALRSFSRFLVGGKIIQDNVFVRLKIG